LKGYLNHFNAVVHTVFCLPEFRARVEYKELGKRKTMITLDDLKSIIKYYASFEDERM